MYFFGNILKQTYLKMASSLGESSAISCQEGRTDIETETESYMCAREGWKVIIFYKDGKYFVSSLLLGLN